MISKLFLMVPCDNTGIATSNPTRITMETPLARKATGSHLIKSTSLEKAQSLVFSFCDARN